MKTLTYDHFSYILKEKEALDTYNLWSGILQAWQVRLTWLNQVTTQCRC